MEFKTLVAVILLILSFVVVALLVFFFSTNASHTGLNKIVSWGWI